VATVLWAGPADDERLRLCMTLSARTSDLALQLAQPADGSTATARASIEQLLLRLSATHPAPGLLNKTRAHWVVLTHALDDAAPTAAYDAFVSFRQAADELAAAMHSAERQRRAQRDAALAGGALVAAAALLGATWAIRRQRRRLRRRLQEASAALDDGAWESAATALRDRDLGAPSAFDALASGVADTLGASERRWRTLADLTADWYWESDAEHRLCWMSGGGPLVTSAGLQPQDLLGRRHQEVEAFDAPADGWQGFQTVLDTRRAFRDMEICVRAPALGREPLWVTISGRPRLDADGRFIGYDGVGRDVSERKRALDRLRASDQRWALMAGLASDYYWESDTDHRMLPLRPEIARRAGKLAEQLEGRTPWEAHPDAMSPSAWAEHREEIAARRPFKDVEMDIEVGAGRHRTVALSGIPRFDGQGRFLGYHGIGRDDTMRREAERLLMRHNETLQRAVTERTQDLELINRDLEAFSRELAHELRTPIGHVQGLAHLLVTKAGDRLASDEMQLIGLQLQAARHMRETVDALLMLARSTIQPLELVALDVSALAREVLHDLPDVTRRAAVQWDLQDGLHAMAAPVALRIVLTNLLGNAAKFTRDVESPRVALTGGPAGDGRLRLRVSDNGAGFDMSQVGRLFKPFGRLHSASAFQGTGIGLTIVQRIIERHGGKVAAHGEPGVGAWFEFTLASDTSDRDGALPPVQ